MIVLMKKKSLIVIAAALVLAIGSFYLAGREPYYLETVAAPADSKGIVVVDAGHGGMDGGAVSPSGVMEKDINLTIAKKVENLLTQKGYTTVMTRVADVSLHEEEGTTIRNKKRADLNKRKELIENAGARCYISIHLNKFEQSSVKGAQVFYGQKNEESKQLAESIRVSIQQQVDPSNKREVKRGDDSIFLLKNVTIPAVIVECGFLSNPEEEQLLQTDEYQQKLANAICDGVVAYLEGSAQ